MPVEKIYRCACDHLKSNKTFAERYVRLYGSLTGSVLKSYEDDHATTEFESANSGMTP